MAIHGTDQRTLVTNFGTVGNSSVVAVDSLITAPTATVSQVPENFVGSGIQIGNNFVLTAGHVVYDSGSTVAAGRVTAGASVGALSTRPSTGLFLADTNFTTATITYPDDYPTSPGFARDIALIQTSSAIGASNIGMVVYMDHDDADGISITTTGFPAVPSAPGTVTTTPVDPVFGYLNEANQAYTSSGTVTSTSSDGQFSYSDTVDTEGGQSGSGVWTTIDDGTGTMLTMVVGVHTNSGNGGHLITPDEYREITDSMETAAGAGSAASAAALPKNALIGSEPGFFSFLTGSGNDYMQGSYRQELIFGRAGNDRVEGREGDDNIFGGAGVDQALFSDLFSSYDFTIVDLTSPEFTFSHARGTAVNGTDMTKEVEFAVFEYTDLDRDGQDDDGDVFFVPLQADPDDPTKLADGPRLTYETEVLDSADADAAFIGTLSADLPAFTLDGDLDYQLTLGAEQSILYNFAYIVDVSGSMSGNNLVQTKAAYQALTEFLINDSIAARSNFAVIPFNSFASVIAGLDGQGAITAVNSLNAGGGTSFGPALSTSENWFESLDTVRSATNIAYFLSDGQGTGASSSLQEVDETLGLFGVPVDVRAFGIGFGADLNSLNQIDSNAAQSLQNPADLIDAFGSSGISRDTIERIDVLVGGVVVDSIAPADLTDDPLGLTYEGGLDGLEVSREADNEVIFRLLFNDGTPPAEVEARVTSGQEEIVEQSDDGTEVRVTFSVSLEDYNATAFAETVAKISIIANDLSNTIMLGDIDASVETNGGDDVIIIGSGDVVVDGGEGTDTARFVVNQAQAGSIARSGDVVSVGSQVSLVNVEFLEFGDGIVDTNTLAAIPLIKLLNTEVLLAEGNAGTTQATLTLELDQASTSDVTVRYETIEDSAEAGSDFVAASGQAVIAAGQTQTTVTLTVNGDTEIESDEAFFVSFAADPGALFADSSTSALGGVLIETDESRIDLAVEGEAFAFGEGDTGQQASPGIVLNRTGSLDQAETVTYTVEGIGASAADASDFATAMSGSVTFTAGEQSKALDIAVMGDGSVEADENFRILLNGTTGNSVLDGPSNVFTILNDDTGGPIPVTGSDGNDLLKGTPQDDLIVSGAGRYDRMFGDLGADIFVFGDETNDGSRDRDVIFDFDIENDAIALTNGAEIEAIRGFSSAFFVSKTMIVSFKGDGDILYLRGENLKPADLTIIEDFDIL